MNKFDKYYKEFIITSCCLITIGVSQLTLIPVITKYNVTTSSLVSMTIISLIILRFIIYLIFSLLLTNKEDNEDPYDHLID